MWGWIASLELPVSLRATLYGLYAKTFDANLNEIDAELTDFPSLVEFFVRPLKSDARPIDQKTNIVRIYLTIIDSICDLNRLIMNICIYMWL